MGGRNSCQGKRCKEEPYGTCKCKSILLCASCFEVHKQDYPHLIHNFILLKEPSPNDNEEQPITWKSLILLKRIYQSPEGSTEVHEAMVKDRPGKFAVKIMFCRGEKELKKKQMEFELQMELSHPSICECKAAFLDETHTSGYKFVIVMEFSENGDIEEEIEKRKLRRAPWSENELQTHMKQLIDAFAYLQDNNLTHGDIKPKNLLLTSDGKIKIGDFGESKQSMQALVTRTYQVTGTVIYFSPLLFSAYLDIIIGKNSTGDVRHNPIKSDVFSLGLSFLHMATLAKPSDLNNWEKGEDLLQQKIEKSIMKITYSESVKNLLILMLKVNESKRYDFKQLKDYMNPPIVERTISEYSSRINRQMSARILDFKGISISQTQGKAYVYDGSSKLVTLTNNKIQSSARAFLMKDSAFVTGGLKGSTSVYKINLITVSAIKLNDMNEGRSWHSIIVYDETVIVFGGRGENKETIASTEYFNFNIEDMTIGKWVQGESLNFSRENATAINSGKMILIIGGSSKRGNKMEMLDSIEKYENGKWTVIMAKLARPTSGIGAISLNENRLLLVGGSREKGAVTNEAFVLDIESSQVAQPMPEANLLEADYFASQCTFRILSKVFFMGSLIGCHKFDEKTAQGEVTRFK